MHTIPDFEAIQQDPKLLAEPLDVLAWEMQYLGEQAKLHFRLGLDYTERRRAAREEHRQIEALLCIEVTP